MPSVESAWIISLSDGIVPYAKSWLIAILHAIQSGILSFIGSPGWGWLPMPSWYYGIYLAFFLLVIGAVGTRFRVFTRSFPYESAAYLVGLIVFVCMTVYWFRESPERMAGRYLYPFMAGPLGIMCWAFRNVSGNIRVGTRVSVSLFGIGLVLLMIGWFGTGFANILGRLLQSSGPFLMRSDHYSTLMATDLAILGMTLIFLSIGFANIGRLWSRIEQAYGPVIIGSATANMLLLAFWIKPLYS